MDFIHYGQQSINAEDIQAVTSVLNSNFLTTGPTVNLFEKTVAEYVGVTYGVAVCNATAALHIACLALGVSKGDIVWTSPNTFLASANCALYCGAQVDFVDIDPLTYNMSVDKLAEKLAEAKCKNALPKVVIPVHFSGQSCDMTAIKQLAEQYGFAIIEDASHAIGGRYLDQPVGSCQYSDISIFSFHPVKIVTTGEGGMAMTNNPELAKRMRLFRCHGMTREADDLERGQDEGWYYEQMELGYNYRITDLQCALGVSQMKRLDEFVSQRHAVVEQYQSLLKDLPITLPVESALCYSAWHLYVIQVEAEQRKHIFNALRAAKIGVNVHYIPVHLQPYYQKHFGFASGDFPNAETYYEQAITLPLFPHLSINQLEYITGVTKELFS